MSTLRTTYIQHPSSPVANITLSEDGSVELPGLASSIGDLDDVDTTSVSDGDVLSYFDGEDGGWLPVQLSFDIDELSDVDTAGVSDGDVLTYSSSTSTWVPLAVDPPPSALGDLSDVDTSGASSGYSLVYDGSSWSPEKVGYDFIAESSDSIAINFSSDKVISRTPSTTSVSFSGTSYTAGSSASVRLLAGGSNISLSFPASWKWITLKPASMVANDVGVLSMTCYGTTESDVVAAWAAGPA